MSRCATLKAFSIFLLRNKVSVCENCVNCAQPLGVYIQKSEMAQRFGVSSSGASGVGVESLAQLRVKFAVL